MSVQELYDQTIKPLSPAERFQLATLILTNIPPESIVDYSHEWSEEDYEDFKRATWMRIESDPELSYDD
jgi:hypothetical protein